MIAMAPPFRDLTLAFRQTRAKALGSQSRFDHAMLPASTASRSSSDHVPLQGNGAQDLELGTVRGVLPPGWVETLELVQASCRDVSNQLGELQRVHQAQLAKVYEDSESEQLERRATSLAMEVSAQIKTADRQVKSLATQHTSARDAKLRKNAQQALVVTLQGIASEFRQIQNKHVARLSARNGGGGSGDGAGDDGDLLDLNASEGGTQVQDTALLQSRHREISQITESVKELHSMFSDLSRMVVDQGTVLDRIDYNIEQAVDQSKEATVHLRKAEEASKNGCAARVIMFLLVGNVVLLIILILKHVRTRN